MTASVLAAPRMRSNHTSVDYDPVLRNAPPIVDTRRISRRPAPHVVKA